MATSIDLGPAGRRYPGRKRAAPERYAPCVSAPSEKRQKINFTNHVPRVAEQLASVTSDDEEAAPPADDSSSKKPRHAPKPKLPPFPQSPPVVTLQAVSSGSAGIRKYLTAGESEEDKAKVDDPTYSPGSDLEDDLESGKNKKEAPAEKEPAKSKKKEAPIKKQPTKPEKTRKPAAQKTTIKSKEKEPDTRPLPSGKPPAYAESRQAMCEAAPFFRAYEGACYAKDGAVYGMLLDGNGGCRSYMDSEIIITRAGGGCTTVDGVSMQSRDQTADSAQIKSMTVNMRTFTPIVLIVGDSNTACPVQVPHLYCVLGWFVVTKIWAEKEPQGKTIFKYRFEKKDLSEQSWWCPQGSAETAPMIANPVNALLGKCPLCLKDSTQIYNEGWTCLNHKCITFHQIAGISPETVPSYSPAFLHERRIVTLNVEPSYDLRSRLRNEHSMSTSALAYYTRAIWKGIVCPRCGRCNVRRFWDRWVCDAKNCSFEYANRMPVLDWEALLEDHSDGFTGHAALYIKCHKDIDYSFRILGNWRVTTYHVLPGCFISHYQANMAINAADHSANQIFIDLQENKAGLQRFERKQSTMKGEFLSTNYTMNFGLPYGYVVQSECKAFSEAPDAILTSLNRLTWAGRDAVGEGFNDFNELLAVGYLKSGKMEYHDDGEKTLGPTVASVSLGGVANMTFRLKAKHYTAPTDRDATILPGSWLADERAELAQDFHDRSDADFNKARVELYKSQRRQPQTCPVLVDLKLSHGDIVIQHGVDLQKFYEHKVACDKELRFAMTARYIKPENIPASEHHKGDFDASRVPQYHGME